MGIRLQSKATFFIGALMASSFGLAAFYGVSAWREHILQMATDRYTALAWHHAKDIFGTYELDGWRGLQSFAEEVRRDSPELLIVSIMDTLGTVVASTDANLIDHSASGQEPHEVLRERTSLSRLDQTGHDWTLCVWAPIMSRDNNGVTKGAVEMTVSLAGTRSKLTAIMRQQALIFALVLIVGIVGTLLIVRKGIVHRLQQLLGATRRVANGDYSPVGMSTTQDEIGELAASFDGMIQALAKSDRYMQEYNHTLMQMVAAEGSRDELDRLIGSISYALIGLDITGTITRWNVAAEAILAVSAETAIGRRFDKAGIPWDNERTRHLLEQCEAIGSAAHDDGVDYRRMDGSSGRLSLTVTPVESPGNDGVKHLSGYVLLGTDITERKRAEAMQARLATAIEQADDSIVITDAQGIIQYVNPAFTRVSGYSSEEAVGQSPRLVKSGLHDQAFYHELWETIRRGDVWHGQLINKRKDGTLLHEKATISPVRDASGRIVNYVGVKRDITQEMALEMQLRQSQKLEAVGSLAAGIAHEINTPIQFVGDNVRFLSDSFADLLTLTERSSQLIAELGLHPEFAGRIREFTEANQSIDLEFLRQETPKAIEETLDGVARVASIVRAMKEFSHPDHGRKAPADLNKAIQSTLTVTHNELKYVANVVTDFDDNLPPVWCHLGDINQVVLNLLVNAAHAIGDVPGKGENNKGTITVSTRLIRASDAAFDAKAPALEGDLVHIAISDTGTGIPEAIRGRIFEHFFTTKGVGRGTGQGLTIARSIIAEKHGGQITFDTEVGKGTTFHIYLPVGAEENVAAAV